MTAAGPTGSTVDPAPCKHTTQDTAGTDALPVCTPEVDSAQSAVTQDASSDGTLSTPVGPTTPDRTSRTSVMSYADTAQLMTERLRVMRAENEGIAQIIHLLDRTEVEKLTRERDAACAAHAAGLQELEAEREASYEFKQWIKLSEYENVELRVHLADARSQLKTAQQESAAAGAATASAQAQVKELHTLLEQARAAMGTTSAPQADFAALAAEVQRLQAQRVERDAVHAQELLQAAQVTKDVFAMYIKARHRCEARIVATSRSTASTISHYPRASTTKAWVATQGVSVVCTATTPLPPTRTYDSGSSGSSSFCTCEDRSDPSPRLSIGSSVGSVSTAPAHGGEQASGVVVQQALETALSLESLMSTGA